MDAFTIIPIVAAAGFAAYGVRAFLSVFRSH